MKVRLMVVLSFLLTASVVFAQAPGDGNSLLAQAARLEAEGKWQQAVPLLEQVVKQQPKNTEALYKLGTMKSWQTENRKESLDLLGRACQLSAENPEYCSAYAEVLSWNSQTRPEAVGQLRKIVAAHPEVVGARLRLAQIYSWNDETRPQALELYEQGLQRDPENADLLVGSADVLAWSSAGRAKAVVRYDQALQLKPNDVRALTGKAQLLAWKGLTADALALYDRALAQDPKNAAALRGKAEILNWKGRHTEARSLATAAEVASPGDDRARLEIARADIGLHQLEQARAVLADVHGIRDRVSMTQGRKSAAVWAHGWTRALPRAWNIACRMSGSPWELPRRSRRESACLLVTGLLCMAGPYRISTATTLKQRWIPNSVTS